MNTLLFILAIILMAAGFAVGLMNLFSPGTVTVGLNYDVAATLFTGGCLLLGLGVVAGAMASRPSLGTDSAPLRRHDDMDDELPDFMSPVSRTAAAAGAGAGAIGAATAAGTGRAYDAVADTASDAATSVSDIAAQTSGTFSGGVDDVASATAGAASSAAAWSSETRDDLSSMFDEATSDAADVASAAKEAAGDAAASIAGQAEATVSSTEETTSDAVDAAEEPLAAEDDLVTLAEESAPDVEAQPDAGFDDVAGEAAGEAGVEDGSEVGAEALAPEDALFVVEERTIRDRPARLLSDGTVEAETDEGWMRFENVEHVEEYLDAMKATA